MRHRRGSVFTGILPLACYLLFRVNELLLAGLPVVQVGLAFLVLFFLPGCLLSGLVLPGRRFRLYELIPLSFSLSVLLVGGSLLVAGLAGAGLRSSYGAVVWALFPYIALTSLVLWRRGRGPTRPAPAAGDEGPRAGAAAHVLLVLAAAALSFWLKDPGLVRSESWIHMKRVNAILLGDAVLPGEGSIAALPTEGAGPLDSDVPADHVAYLLTALLALGSGVHPVTVFLNSPGIYAPLLMLSFFAFALACLRRPWAAAAAALLMSVWLSGFFERAAWPQYGTAVLLYTALWLLFDYIEDLRAPVLVLCVLVGAFAGALHSSYFLRWYFTLGAFITMGFVFLAERRALAAVLGAAALTLLLTVPYHYREPVPRGGRAADVATSQVRSSHEAATSEGVSHRVDLKTRAPRFGFGGQGGAAGPATLLRPGNLIALAFALMLLLRRRKGFAEVFLVGLVFAPAVVFLAHGLAGFLGRVPQGGGIFVLWQADLIYPLLCSYAVFVLPGAARSRWLRCGTTILAALAVALFVAPVVEGNLDGYRASREERLSPSPYDWREGYAYLESLPMPSLILTDELTAYPMSAFTRHRELSFSALRRILPADVGRGVNERALGELAVLSGEVGLDGTVAMLAGHGVDYVLINFDYFGDALRAEVLERLDGHPEVFPKVYDSGPWVVFRVAGSAESVRARAGAFYAAAWKAAQAGDWERMAGTFHSVLLLDPLNLGGEVRLEAEVEGTILFATINPASHKAERRVYLLGDTYVGNMLECRRILDPSAYHQEVERLVGELDIRHVVVAKVELPNKGRVATWPVVNLALNPLRFGVEYASDGLAVYRVLGDDRERALMHLVDALAALGREDPTTAQVEAAKARELRPGDPAVLEGVNEVFRRVGWHAREAALQGQDALEAGRSGEALGLFKQALHLGEGETRVLRGFFRALGAVGGGERTVLAGYRCGGDACGPAVDGEILAPGTWADLGDEGVGFVDVDLARRRFLKDVWVTTYIPPGDAAQRGVRAVSVFTSLDGVWWTPAGSLRGWATEGEGIYTFLLENLYRYGRYLRVVIEGGVGIPLRVDEVELWEYARLTDVQREGMWTDFRGPSIRLGHFAASYEAEALHRLVGVERADPEASAGTATMLTSGEEEGYILCGPQERFPAGSYRAIFRLRADDPRPSVQVAVLDVASDRGQTVHRRVELFGADFARGGVYREFPLTFHLPQPAELEFRVYAAGSVPLWADAVRVEVALDTYVLVEADRTRRVRVRSVPPRGVTSYEAEAYSEGVGRARYDEGALNGAALQGNVRRDDAGMLLILPSPPLEAGVYEVAFRLKVARHTVPDEVAVLSVVGDEAQTASASRALRGHDFADRLAYRSFPLHFVAEKGESFEYRVMFRDVVDVWVDSVLVRRLPEPGGEP